MSKYPMPSYPITGKCDFLKYKNVVNFTKCFVAFSHVFNLLEKFFLNLLSTTCYFSFPSGLYWCHFIYLLFEIVFFPYLCQSKSLLLLWLQKKRDCFLALRWFSEVVFSFHVCCIKWSRLHIQQSSYRNNPSMTSAKLSIFKLVAHWWLFRMYVALLTLHTRFVFY